MKQELGETLNRLCRRERNSIWLRRVLRRSAPWFACSALALFAAGLVHRLVLPLGLTLTLLLTLAPTLLLACAVALREKPQPQEAAAAADRQYGANSLLVSAWELSRSPGALPPTGELLLQRCQAALPGWLQSSAGKTTARLGPATMLLLTLAAIGLFLLSLPSTVDTRRQADAGAEATAPVAEAGNEASRVLGNLVDSDPGRQAPGPSQAGDASPTTATAPGAPEPAQLAEASSEETATADAALSPGRPSNSLAADSPAAPPPATAAGDNESKRLANRQAGSEAAAPSDSVQPGATEFERIEMVAIETGSGAGASARDGSAGASGPLESSPGSTKWKNTGESPAGEITAGGFRYLLSPQQRSLVQSYLQKLENIDVPTN